MRRQLYADNLGYAHCSVKVITDVVRQLLTSHPQPRLHGPSTALAALLSM
jgi:hypothetical protein